MTGNTLLEITASHNSDLQRFDILFGPSSQEVELAFCSENQRRTMEGHQVTLTRTKAERLRFKFDTEVFELLWSSSGILFFLRAMTFKQVINV